MSSEITERFNELEEFCKEVGGSVSEIENENGKNGIKCDFINGNMRVFFSKYGPRIDVYYEGEHYRSYTGRTGNLIENFEYYFDEENEDYILESSNNILMIAEDREIIDVYKDCLNEV